MINHWLLDSVGERRQEALALADRVQIHQELGLIEHPEDLGEVVDLALVLELVVLDLIADGLPQEEEDLQFLRKTSTDAFRLFRAGFAPDAPVESGQYLLRMGALGVLGDRGADAARFLKQRPWPPLPVTAPNYRERTWAVIVDVWLRLIRKDGWADRDAVLEGIQSLRVAQGEFEEKYLLDLEAARAKPAALELIGLYHLAKAAEVLALFITDGRVEGNYRVDLLLESHFDRALAVCSDAQLLEFEPLCRLLSACARQLIENSIWTVTRSVNSRVTKFVQWLVDKGRGDKALFDVLPPQRRTLAEAGLLGSSRRAVVVSLPTSSGKTMIAQFRILQALNQFDHEQGWVAYLAPTRALVNQVTRQFRRDFSPLGIQVEQVSPALELDGFETELLAEQDPNVSFRVLVTTPEKLDLMMRGGWEGRIGRPLTLVVVDEAHNISAAGRGLKLELLLATINKECERAQFLLLTPFIQNAREVARWLGGRNSDDISLAVDWQPNDRLIGIAQLHRGRSPARKSSFGITLETVHTTHNTVAVDESLTLVEVGECPGTYSQQKSVAKIAALTAQHLSSRGPVIVMHASPSWVWGLTRFLADGRPKKTTVTHKRSLVCDYVKLELGPNFPLIDLLERGIGVHHSGLPPDIRSLMEWLFEEQELDFLAATTTIAQGVNFPVSAVVMASNVYPARTGSYPMPVEDFWNIAGRAGRVGQGELGVVALAAEDSAKAERYREFVNLAVGDLNSELIHLALEAQEMMEDLQGIVYKKPAWSPFLQYLSHSYLQMGKPPNFGQQIEQVLRGTLGFEKLRQQNRELALKLLQGIQGYTDFLREPGQPLRLVDSTGFSLQSIRTVLKSKKNFDIKSWNSQSLFSNDDPTLKNVMGVLLKVPELRDNLREGLGSQNTNGEKLALLLKDWVNGVPLPEIALHHFSSKSDEEAKDRLTRCGQTLFGKIAQTASWGLGALLAIAGSELTEKEMAQLNNLPSRIYYGVNSDAAIAMRMLGVPRSAAPNLAVAVAAEPGESLPSLRARLSKMAVQDWQKSMGPSGRVYWEVWKVLEGSN